MVFTSPPYIHKLLLDPPDNVPVYDFVFPDGDKYNRHPMEKSQNPFTCGITGKTYTAAQVKERFELLARSLGKAIGAKVDEGTELDKVIGVFTVNAIDTLTCSWAAHRLNGASSPISASYSAPELTRQLKTINAKALFTCVPLLSIAYEAAEAAGLPKENIFLIEVPEKAWKGANHPSDIKTVDQLIEEGKSLPEIPKVKFAEGQGEKQTAFLISSSGTSGLPKNVRISHRGVIANTLSYASSEANFKKNTELALGVLPLSHCYPLVLMGHMTPWRGDGLVVLPAFDLYDVLQSVQDYKLARTYMVPPMMVGIIRAKAVADKYDLESVNITVVAASNLTREVNKGFTDIFVNCKLCQGYGLTESTVAVAVQNPEDTMFGALGHILPGYEAKLLDDDDREITGYDTRGELVVRSPSTMQGYLNNEEATKEAFTADGWLRTGDLMELRKSEKGNENLFIVDRKKEMIKVRGMQVSPTEIEGLLSNHPKISDVCVVPLPNDAAGEVPIAFVVKAPDAKDDEEGEKALRDSIHEFVNAELADHKRLAGGIEFVDSLPKTGSNKTQRGTMKQKARAIAEAAQKRAQAPAVVQSFEFDSDDDSDDE